MDPNASPSVSSIRVLTHNCWGLKYIATHRHARLAEIGNRIAAASPPADIVGLQECWTQQDYEAIRQRTKHLLPYGKFYHSGIFGGGLVILSRWPIEESNMVRYPLNGRPAAFYRGDWYVGKGVACARIRYGAKRRDVVEVFCTHVSGPSLSISIHLSANNSLTTLQSQTADSTCLPLQLHAPYESEPNDSYLCHRTAQAWEIAKLMRHAHERGHLVIGLGDFNMRASSLAHRLIETHSGARDVWRLLHPDSSLGSTTDAAELARNRPVPTASYNLSVNGATCDSALNTWRWEKRLQKQLDRGGPDIVVPDDAPDPRAKRLDYIFAAAGSEVDDGGEGEKGRRWAVTSARVGLTERHPTLRCSLSDHFSVEAVLELVPVSPASPANGVADYHSTTTTSNKPLIPLPLPSSITTKSPSLLPPSTYTTILALTQTYTLRERRQQRLRLSHAVGQTVLAVGCLVGIWWVPAGWPAFLLALAAALGTGVAVLEGLMGGLFVRSEVRALKEFEWEIRNARARALAEGGKDGGVVEEDRDGGG